MFNSLIAWSLNNRLLVLAATLVLFVAGGYTLQQMATDVFPEFAPPQVVIQTEAPGMAPADVETLITYPLESAINGTPAVAHVRSQSSVGLSTVTVVFNSGTDIYLDRQLTNERIQGALNRLPAGAQTPVMLPVTSAVGSLVKYALVSDSVSSQELRTLSDWEIRPRILALGGIASVVAIGGDVKQYQVRLDPKRLLAYRVSLDEVRQALQQSNLNVPGAFLQQHGSELNVVGVGRISSLDDLKNTIITRHGNIPITVANVADVGFGGEIKRGDGAFDLKPAVIGTISKAYGADTLTTTKKVDAALQEIKTQLPAGVTLETQVFRQANFIDAAIHNLNLALAEGALVVIGVLFLFLMNWRASVITFLSMPASFVGGILVMHALGVGINSMTLGGLAIAIGEVVDNGIITVENVVRRLRLNRNAPKPASTLEVVFDAVREILNSVVYATLIVILIFMPIFFLQGLAGRIFAPLGVSYIASVLASLVVAVTAVPALCYVLLARRSEHQADDGKLLKASDETQHATVSESDAEHERETRFVIWLKSHFLRLLQLALRRSGWVIGIAGALLALSAALLPFFGRSFLPEFHEGNYVISMTMLPGTDVLESMRIGRQVRTGLLKYKQVVSVDQHAGRSEIDEDAQPPNYSEFDVRLDFARDPSLSADALLESIRRDLNSIPGATFSVGQFIKERMDEVVSGARAQVAVKIFGDDLGTLYGLGQQVQGVVETVPGAVDINLQQHIDVPQLTIKIDRQRAARYGLKVGDVASDIATLLNGETVSTVLEGQRTFDLYVRLGEQARNSIPAIRGMLIDVPGSGGTAKIPLRDVADVDVQDKPYQINRENVQRLIILSFNVQGRSLGSVLGDVQANVEKKLVLPPGYFIEYGGQFQSQQEAGRVLLGFGLLALFGALMLLYKAFGNFRESLLVLCNLPLAMIGGVVALFIAGGDMSTAAVIGFITLFGIATRNGIILVTHYDQLRREGRRLENVVVHGTMNRLVPVLMTAATAALGLIPLLWGSPVGKELERPLAQVVLGGLVTSTFLNLFVIPTLYSRIEHWREARRSSVP